MHICTCQDGLDKAASTHGLVLNLCRAVCCAQMHDVSRHAKQRASAKGFTPPGQRSIAILYPGANVRLRFYSRGRTLDCDCTPTLRAVRNTHFSHVNKHICFPVVYTLIDYQ